MKNIIKNTLLLALFTKPVLASTPSEKFEQLVSDSKEMASVLSNYEDCEFQIKKTQKGYRLAILVGDRVKKVELEVTKQMISSTSFHDDQDGSFEHVYEFANGGKLTLTHLDDASDAAELSDGQKTLDCTIEN